MATSLIAHQFQIEIAIRWRTDGIEGILRSEKCS